MRRKIMPLTLCALLFFQSAVSGSPVYAEGINPLGTQIEHQEMKSNRVVYLTDGEGTLGDGSGTKVNPYTNIRTALAEIQDGETLKLIGHVKYTKYDQYPNGAAVPLIIDKSITIEGDDEYSSGLIIRTAIQLAADVTFKNMRLQMTPEVTLGRTAESANSRILGEEVERSTTIYLAGHSLTLDNVNTKMGESLDQYDTRPYISGGTNKAGGEVGDTASVTVINPNSETKLSAIYAGDYWRERTMDVQIRLDASCVDTTLYTGGLLQPLHGNVTVMLYDTNNITKFDRSNHDGALNVRLMEDTYTTILDINEVDDLVLENGAKILIPKNKSFKVNNLTLKDKTLVNFQLMSESPIVSGNFTGVSSSTNIENCGGIILNNEQTLQIAGEVTGLTRLNIYGEAFFPIFKENHVYITANKASSGDFSIEGTQYTQFELKKENNGESTTWTTYKKLEEGNEGVHSFSWLGGPEKIVAPKYSDVFYFPVEFRNGYNETYRPELFEILLDYEIEMKTVDGTIIDIYEGDIALDWDVDRFGDDVTDPYQLFLSFDNIEDIYGDYIITITHIATGKQISRELSVVLEDDSEEEPEVTPSLPPVIPPTIAPSEAPTATPEATPEATPTATPTAKPIVKPEATPEATPTAKPTVKPTAKPTAKPTVKPTAKPTAKPTVKPTAKPTVKPKVTLNKKSVTLYTKGATTTQLKATVVGKSKKVTYTSSNTKVAKVDKNGKVTALKEGKTTITVKANGVHAKCTVVVKKPTLSVGSSKRTVKRGKKITLKVKATPARTITFKSNKPSIASVNKKGVITGKKAGKATISVSCNGITKKVIVTVKK